MKASTKAKMIRAVLIAAILLPGLALVYYGAIRVADPTTTAPVEKKDGADDVLPANHATILELTDDTFLSACGKGRQLFVQFHSPFCGHCTAFRPTYKAVAERVRTDPTLNACVTIATVDVTRFRARFKKYGLSGTPTMLGFAASGDCETPSYTYKGKRDVDSIVQELTKQCQA
ncbi:hypothetical protein AGDE_14759 [Angomonas deanei]|uniref:Thioredoxin/OST3 / OST6 family, transporter family, putative n=1 Tax=Angomonas deanei TaxID=59799 RepID=A0A7G2C4L5_9TRYP|nr:hypothetical protein AGDE_14759 [Angomonas deanei]CAD2214559.1 Thioredoxin/OST3 / OST6 family, transporter family, putative [Angomonas deanei]|eukprot:EPY20281.1 hypothetical protein AGDE_14759 [Angomonas deanei]